MWQNIDLWILAVSGVIAMLAALWHEVYHWQSSDRIAELVETVIKLATFLAAGSGSYALQNLMPSPPLQSLWENIPDQCKWNFFHWDMCTEGFVFYLALAFLLVPVYFVCLAIVWAPSWLIRSLRRR